MIIWYLLGCGQAVLYGINSIPSIQVAMLLYAWFFHRIQTIDLFVYYIGPMKNFNHKFYF